MLRSVDEVLEALAGQQAELSDVLATIADHSWGIPTRCVGWDVGDVVLHLAQADEAAIASAIGRLVNVDARPTERSQPAASIDDVAATMVESERGLPGPALRERWTSAANRLGRVLQDMDLSTRVTWVAGTLSARTLATTRMAETWIHTGDIADALHITIPPTDRLRLIARLAWRTLPYAFALVDRPLIGPVAFRLVSPEGEQWNFLPDEPAVTVISGPALELCTVAARRIDPSITSLRGEGPNADDVLALIRTYA
jgi:uncharacterized protein (TIGR03084 family)